MDLPHQSLSDRLASLAQEYDLSGEWPAEAMKVLTEYGCWRWMIPKAHGGDGLRPIELVEGYEAIARGCMSVALPFTQHDAAVDLIATGENGALKERRMPQLAAGETLLTVGISQLTTSRQGGEPAMKVEWDGSTARFTGLMPWVTSAAFTDAIVTGGVLPDGSQMTACVPTDAEGLAVEPPMELAALQSTWTTAVRCENVTVDAADVVRGPVEKALSVRGTVRPMVVSATGLGLAGAMIQLLNEIAPRRPAELRAFADAATEQYKRVRKNLYAAADTLADPTRETPQSEVRASVNELLMRLALTLTTLAKGTGYLRNHPAQRLVREAHFFLVWSAPDALQVSTLERLLNR